MIEYDLIKAFLRLSTNKLRKVGFSNNEILISMPHYKMFEFYNTLKKNYPHLKDLRIDRYYNISIVANYENKIVVFPIDFNNYSDEYIIYKEL